MTPNNSPMVKEITGMSFTLLNEWVRDNIRAMDHSKLYYAIVSEKEGKRVVYRMWLVEDRNKLQGRLK